ncbi:hypothetical protein KCP77_19485 [Salmonella enterica subsp. enterica]|nr:hypothetical protein KCP77_19485 [Salmonella enterica subsp. enterica]
MCFTREHDEEDNPGLQGDFTHVSPLSGVALSVLAALRPLTSRRGESYFNPAFCRRIPRLWRIYLALKRW